MRSMKCVLRTLKQGVPFWGLGTRHQASIWAKPSDPVISLRELIPESSCSRLEIGVVSEVTDVVLFKHGAHDHARSQPTRSFRNSNQLRP